MKWGHLSNKKRHAALLLYLVAKYNIVMATSSEISKKAEQEASDLIIDRLMQAPIQDDEFDFLSTNFSFKYMKKGALLLCEGEVQTTTLHNFKGCVRQYYLKDGEEKTTFFYTDDQGIYALSNFTQQTPSPYFLECVEDTLIGFTTLEQEKELYRRFPRLERLCRVETEFQLGIYQQMLAHYIMASPEERYLHLLDNRPELFGMVPQHQIASYLGVKPESLSRIRRRITERRSKT